MSAYPVIGVQSPVRSVPGKILGAEFFDRLIAFYKRQKSNHLSLSAIWQEMTTLPSLSQLIEALDDGNRNQLIEILDNAYTGELPGGFDEIGCPKTQWFVEMCNSLADCTGFSRVSFNGQAVPAEINAEELFDYVHQRYGFSCNYFGGGSAIGFSFPGRFVTTKTLESTVAMIQLERSFGTTPNSILEIGGGFGFCANVILGKPDLIEYHSIDLPFVAVIQAYIVACCHGESSVVLNGEAGKGKYKVHGLTLPEARYDCAVNVNSMPEIPEKEAVRLVEHVENSMSRGGMFFSINHESPRGGQHRLFDTIGRRAAWTQVCRCPAWPSWGRDGYLQEVWDYNAVEFD